ncbi:MAG: hypothetical protein WCJ11_12155 [Methylococcaceae bacterium]
MPNQQRATIDLTTRQQHDDFLRLHGGKSAFDLMLEQQAIRLKVWHNQQFYYLPASLIPKSAFKASKSLKQSTELLADLVNTRTALCELARLFATLSLQTANYQRGISERIVIAMTFKNRSASLQSTVLFTIFRGRFNNEQKMLFTTS